LIRSAIQIKRFQAKAEGNFYRQEAQKAQKAQRFLTANLRSPAVLAPVAAGQR
jgi:hypothetical protein